MKVLSKYLIACAVIWILVIICYHGFRNGNQDSRVYITRFGDTLGIYKLKDTIIYGPSANDDVIHLYNLPEWDMSFEQIEQRCGRDNLLNEEEYVGLVDNLYDEFQDSIPEQIIERCHPYIGKHLSTYVMTFKYPDDSGDYLHLIVTKEDNNYKVLWGIRIPAHFSYIWDVE